MIKVAETVETIDGPSSPELGRGWALLTRRLVVAGCGNTSGHHVWSHFVSARAVVTSDGLVVRTVPLPYPVRLLPEEVEAQTLVGASSSLSNKKLRCYTGSMSLTLSDARWSPCLVLEAGKVCYGLRHPSPERKGAACRAVLTLEGLHELPNNALLEKEEGQGGRGLWNRFIAEWNATFFTYS